MRPMPKQLRGHFKARYDQRVASAEADYKAARQRCDDLAGDSKDRVHQRKRKLRWRGPRPTPRWPSKHILMWMGSSVSVF